MESRSRQKEFSVSTPGIVIGNQDGSVMVMALLIMAILTVMGISAIKTTTVDLQISINERQFKRSFYRAEGAANEAMQLIDDVSNSDNIRTGTGSTWDWIEAPGVDMDVAGNWTSGNSTLASINDNVTRYAAVMKGIAAGASLDMTAPSQLYEYEIYGLHNSPTQGRTMIKMGYRKRF